MMEAQDPVDRARTLELHHGTKARPTFSPAEMARRVGMLREHMAREALDAVLLTSIHNVNYFADFVYCSFGRHYGLVVTGDRHTTISANIDYGQPWRQSLDGNLTYTDWHRDSFFVAARELLPRRGRVGIEHDHVTLATRAKLEVVLPGVELRDVAEATMRMRMVKSPEEHAVVRDGAAVADIGGAACIEAIEDGVPEHEVALHATGAMVREIARRYPHTELMDTWTWFQSGINTDGAHNPVTTRQVREGDVLSLNCFAMISGYYQALERTLFYRTVSDRALELWSVNCEVHRRGLELIRPGVRCCDIAAELNEIYARHGLLDRRTFGYGHSFGTLCHYYGREAGLELREDVETVIEPDMVVSMEPMITIPEGQPGAGGYREHDILIVTTQGAENVTGFPYGPEHNVVG
jgi:creatinase